MNIVTFSIGTIASKLSKYPSKTFSIFIAAVLSLLSWYLGSSFAPIADIAIPFLNEWYALGTKENFPMYLVLASYMLLIGASIAQISIYAFDSACYVKQKYDLRIPQL
ncbi:hypothetical protein L1D46_07820 [Pseudoalteromonas sp. Isolate3]|uniref:hypothetical protein n=1 Tax=Pseudoalteromonas sp. Isolate3 TaxID=2908526 RepID=UPI001EFE2A5F|nr:hypothetical protein [Pseudoalteromonas sp. Isolate3]MCG9708712.1 hypothetical protein [Pseudoalteromonas sp. Isolate3]